MVNVNELIAEGKLDDAASVLYDAFMCMINAQTNKINLTRSEWDKVAPKLIEKMQNPETVKVPTDEPGDDIDILSEKANLVVSFVVPEGFKAPDKITKKIYIGTKYNVPVPVIAGLETTDVIEGTMTEEGADVTVTYTEVEPAPEVKGTLIITYEGPEGDDEFVAPEGVIREYNVGEEFMVESPAVDGYTPDQEVVSGAMVEDGIDVTITYSKDE